MFNLALFDNVTVLLISQDNDQFPSMRSFSDVIHSNEAFVWYFENSCYSINWPIGGDRVNGAVGTAYTKDNRSYWGHVEEAFFFFLKNMLWSWSLWD